MKRLFPLALLCLALAGCGSPTVNFSLTFDTADTQKQSELLQAATRVIGRRLSRFEGVTPEKVTAKPQGSGSTLLTFDVQNTEARTTLVEEIQKPFSLRIMLLSPVEKGDIFVEEQGWFNETGITEKDIGWVEASANERGKGVVRLVFTEQGHARLAAVMSKNPTGVVGLFVRGRLMSKLQVKGEELSKEILIQDIPNPLLADIFADDVNVGTHVTFSLSSS